MTAQAPRPPQGTPGRPDLNAATRALNAWIEIDAGALASNLAAIRSWIDRPAEIISVVKANAYGHGARETGRVIESLGADRLATISVPEAIALRDSGVAAPILVLGHAFPEEAEAAVQAGATLTVHSRALGEAISRAASDRDQTARVHIKVDTGLHRFGVEPHEAIALADELRCMPGLEVEGLWTHMANADEPDDRFTDGQLERFGAVAQRLSWIPFRHVANSGTTLRRPGLQFEGVRVGLGQWGYRPGPYVPGPELTPVLSLRARLARVREMLAGDGVGYGLTWRAPGKGRVGLVPIGYGDGWRRELGNRGDVLLQGRRVPMAGRVMMDQFCIDLASGPVASEGDVVTLIGRDGGESIGVAAVAAIVGTIEHEVVTALQARLPRFVHRDGILVEG